MCRGYKKLWYSCKRSTKLLIEKLKGKKARTMQRLEVEKYNESMVWRPGTLLV